MIVYRVQAATHTATGWVTEFYPTLEEARSFADDLAAVFAEVHVDQIDVPMGRAGLCEALNRAHGNRVDWPGEPMWRSPR